MMINLVRKEVMEYLLTMRFFLGLTICTILFAISTFVFIGDYIYSLDKYNAVQSENENLISGWTVFNQVSPAAVRKPVPISIFAKDKFDRWGNKLNVSVSRVPVLSNDASGSGSSSDFLAFFENLDFSKMLQIFISLFAFLFSYDAICGEKERGSLKLMMSNSIPRFQIISAKLLGVIISITVIILISFTTSSLILAFSEVKMLLADWFAFASIILLTILLAAVFSSLGVLISTLVQSNSVSLSLVLLLWVVLVIIYPNVVAASFDQKAMRQANEQLQTDLRHLDEQYNDFKGLLGREMFKDYIAVFYFASSGEGMDRSILYRLAGENAHKEIVKRLPEYVDKQREYALKRRDLELEFLTRKMSILGNLRMLQRISPSIIYTDACLELAQQSAGSYENFVRAAQLYREELLEYMAGNGAFSTIRYVSDDYDGMPAEHLLATIETMTAEEQQRWAQNNMERLRNEFFPIMEGVEKDPRRKLDLSDMPRFKNSQIEKTNSNAGLDALVLALYTLVFGVIAVVRFNSYDVR
jgi:ABC-type transport system involved in multi-copper enzyme maturation permease subunit